MLSCSSRSPFTVSPAHYAVQEPCRYMGTLHRESRTRLERLRMCAAITEDDWLCMSRALQALDRDFTARCKSDSISYTEIADDQRGRYRNCAVAADRDTIECTLLSTDSACITNRCTPNVSRESLLGPSDLPLSLRRRCRT